MLSQMLVSLQFHQWRTLSTNFPSNRPRNSNRSTICKGILSVRCQAQGHDPVLTYPRTRSRATCYMQILKPQSAVADFRKVLTLEPNNATVRAQMVSTQKLIRKIEFEKVRPRTL